MTCRGRLMNQEGRKTDMNKRGTLASAFIGPLLMALVFALGCSTSDRASSDKAEVSEPFLATPTASPHPTANTGEDRNASIIALMDKDTSTVSI